MSHQRDPTGPDTQQGAISAALRQQEPEVIDGNIPSTIQPSKSTNVSYWSLPKKGQLACLCLARLADPIAMGSIASYLYFQLKWFDPSQSPATIATQAGFLIGAKTAAQVCTAMFWGRLADSEYGGRKTVLSIGLINAAVSMLGFGFSRSYASAIVWQIVNGSMNANVSMVRCMVAELNPEKRNRTRALLLLPLFANAGILLGPLIGGLLASNNTDIQERSLTTRYPYATPNIVIAIIYVTAALGVMFGTEETLEALQDGRQSFAARILHKLKQKIRGRSSTRHAYTAVPIAEIQDNPTVIAINETQPNSSSASPLIENRLPKRKKKLPFRRIWTFNVICTLLSNFVIAGHIGTFSAMWAIFLSTPTADPSSQHPPIHFTGGLGMNPRSVGFAMSLLGATGVVLQAVLYPPLNDRYGTIKVWRAALFIFPFVYLLAPFPALVASSASTQGATKTALTWVAMSGVLFLYVVGRTGVTPATALLINDCTPHPSVRGTIHTAGTMVGNLSRSVFPVMTLTIFGRGLNIGVVGLGFWCIMFLAILACVASRWVTEGTNGKEIILEDEDEEEESQQEQGRLSNGETQHKVI